MVKKKYTIAITGINATDNPGPGIAVIKSLRAAESFDVRIIGLAYEILEPGIFRRDLIDKSYLLPFPGAGQDNLLTRFEEINEIEHIDFLFPNFDAELFNFIKQESIFKRRFNIKMVLPTVKQFEERHKSELGNFGKKYDIKIPKTDAIYNESEIVGKLSNFNFPLVMKGKFYDAKIVHNIEESVQAFYAIKTEWGLPILLQKFIEGRELNVCAIGDGKGNTLGAVPMRKLDITEKGKAWSGITIADKKLLKITQTIISETKWRGPMELEFIKKDNGKYYLLEINPRFPAWCFLPTGAGQNQVETIVNMGMGNDVEQLGSYDVGKLFIRYSEDMIVDLKQFEEISTKREL